MTEYEMLKKTLLKYIELNSEFIVMLKKDNNWCLEFFQYDSEKNEMISESHLSNFAINSFLEYVDGRDNIEYSFFYPEDLFQKEKCTQIFL